MRSLKDEQYRSPEPPTLSQAEIDEDPHGIYRRLRPITPVIRRKGGSYIAIRARDVPAARHRSSYSQERD